MSIDALPQGRTSAGWLLALAMVGVAALLQPFPDLAVALQLDRQSWPEQPWRLFSAHLVHWRFAHLAGNAGALLLLARLAGPRAPSPAWALAGLLLCSATVVWLLPDLASYRGSSTLVAIYLVPAAATLWAGGGLRRGGATALLVLYVGRLVADAVGHWPSPLLPADVRSTWELHLLGMSWGALGLLRNRPWIRR